MQYFTKTYYGKLLFLALCLCFADRSQCQVIINEVLPGNTVELKNIGETSIDVSTYWLCNFPDYVQLSDLTLECGTLVMEPGAVLAVNDFTSFSAADGEMGLYTGSEFGNVNLIIDYMEWGNSGHRRSALAAEAGIWTEGDFVEIPDEGASLSYDGEGDSAADWQITTTPTICAENGIEEELTGDIIISEVFPDGTVELKNVGETTVDVSTYWLCNFPAYVEMSELTLECGSLVMEPGDIIAVNDFTAFNAADGEMGLYTRRAFGDSTAIISYVEWGSSGHRRSDLAASVGEWVSGEFVPAFAAGQSIEYGGEGVGAASWNLRNTPTICAENEGPEPVVGDIIINEVFPDGTVELKNVGETTVDVSTYWLCNFPAYVEMSELTLECGSLVMEPGDIIAVNDFTAFNAADGEMGLYTRRAFGDSTAIISYVEWGSSGHRRSDLAASVGEWVSGEFVPAFAAGQSIEYGGEGVGAASWNLRNTPTICAENEGPEPVVGDIIINEVFPDGTVELKNVGETTVDVSTYWLCNFPAYVEMSELTLECGSLVMEPGDIIAVNDFTAFNAADGEMGLYTRRAFGDSTAIISYVEWGSSGHRRSDLAASVGEWVSGEFVPAFAAGQSLEYGGEGVGAASWNLRNTPTICAENEGPEPVVGDIIINEVFPDGTVELKNVGETTVDVSTYWLCNFPAYVEMSELTLECGSLVMEPGDIIAVNDFTAFNAADGEMGLYTRRAFGDSTAIISYVEWGSSGHRRSDLAASVGEWVSGEFVPAFAAGQSIEYGGEGVGAASWNLRNTPTICAENEGPEPVVGDIIINEVFPDGTVELKNVGETTVDVSTYWLCNFPAYVEMSELTLECGSLVMEPGDIIAVNDFTAFNAADGEMGLYTRRAFGDSTAIISYVEWGSSGHRRSDLAASVGEWVSGEFVPAFAAGQSIEYGGEGVGAASWNLRNTPTICAENEGPEPVVGDIIINEVFPDGTVELKNVGETTVDVSTYWLCNFPAYVEMSELTLECGSLVMEPGDIIAVNDFTAFNAADGEMGLYTRRAFGDSTAIISYVEWGSSGHRRSDLAASVGEWVSGEFVPAFEAGQSLEYGGEGVGAASWNLRNTPTICAENEGPEETTFGVVNFILWDAENDVEIGPISDGDVIDLSTLASERLSIVAITNPSTVGSVLMQIRGRFTFNKVERSTPYNLFGKNRRTGTSAGALFKPGNYQLEATPFEGRHLNGAQGESLSIRFRVIRSGSAAARSLADAETTADTPGFTVFPNPVRNETLFLSLPAELEEEFEIRLLDQTGRMLTRYRLDPQLEGQLMKIDLLELNMPPGIYFVQLYGKVDAPLVEKFIKSE